MNAVIFTNHKASAQRRANADALAAQVGGTVYCGTGHIMDDFLAAVGTHQDGVLFIEDDMRLHPDFLSLLPPLGWDCVQFFDFKRQSYAARMPGSTFCCVGCVWLPQWLCASLAEFRPNYAARYPQHPTATDFLVRFALVRLRRSYYITRPCLAQHHAWPSCFAGRSTRRQTPFFDERA